MSRIFEIIGIIFLILLGILAVAEGIPNLIYNQYKEDCEDYETFYEQSFITDKGYCDGEVEITIEDNLKVVGFVPECVEEEVVEWRDDIKPYDYCHDICDISSFCRKFAKEHNINTTTGHFREKHKRNPKETIIDYCDLNTGEQHNKCLDMCADNYYYDELEHRWNETICIKEILVRYIK